MTKMLYKGFHKLVEEIGELVIELSSPAQSLFAMVDESVDVVAAIDYFIQTNDFVDNDKFKSISFMAEESTRLVMSSVNEDAAVQNSLSTQCLLLCGRSLQTLGKIGGFPTTVEHPDGEMNLHDRVTAHLAGLRASCALFLENNNRHANSSNVRYENKFKLFQEWDINGILVPTEKEYQ